MKRLTTATLLQLCVAWAGPALAQLNGNNLLGDFGLSSGTQAPPGFYTGLFYYRYGTDTIRNRNGDPFQPDPQGRGEFTLHAFAPVVVYVSKAKLLGANYGAFLALPFANSALEAPVFGLQDQTATHIADLYVQPINLGWHKPRADYTAGFGLFAPTGRYEPDGDDNTGLGMWGFELFGGTTLFLDSQKRWNLATTAFWETHTKKKDSDAKVGDILTLEGGLGRSFLKGAVNVGAAYYAQWKLTEDDFGTRFHPAGGSIVGKHQVFALGPDVTLPVATKTKLVAFVNVRYLWEFGVRTKSEGTGLVVTATFPVPSVPLH